MSACGRLLYFVKHRGLLTLARRNVTTWSPVGAAFNARTHRRSNLFEKNVVCICFNVSVLLVEPMSAQPSSYPPCGVCPPAPGAVRGAGAQLSCGIRGGHQGGSEEHRAPAAESLFLLSGGWNSRVLWPALRWFVQSGWSGEFNYTNHCYVYFVWIVFEWSLWVKEQPHEDQNQGCSPENGAAVMISSQINCRIITVSL